MRHPRWDRIELTDHWVAEQFNIPPCKGCRRIQFHAGTLPAPLQPIATELRSPSYSALDAGRKITLLYPIITYINVGVLTRRVLSSWLEAHTPVKTVDPIEKLRGKVPPPPPPPPTL